jgi:hypothetical protein
VPWPYPIVEAWTDDYRSSVLDHHRYVKEIFAETAGKHGWNEKALLVGTWALYFCEFEAETLDWESYRNLTEIGSLRDPQAIYDEIFIHRGFDFIIVGDHPYFRTVDFWNILNGEEFRKLVKVELSRRGFAVLTRRQ